MVAELLLFEESTYAVKRCTLWLWYVKYYAMTFWRSCSEAQIKRLWVLK